MAEERRNSAGEARREQQVMLNEYLFASLYSELRRLSYAARAMRGLLIDFARRRQALKRGAGFEITDLDTQIGQPADCVQLERLAGALDELAVLDARLILCSRIGEL